jgi:hypothetical protein
MNDSSDANDLSHFDRRKDDYWKGKLDMQLTTLTATVMKLETSQEVNNANVVRRIEELERMIATAKGMERIIAAILGAALAALAARFIHV